MDYRSRHLLHFWILSLVQSKIAVIPHQHPLLVQKLIEKVIKKWISNLLLFEYYCLDAENTLCLLHK